MSKKKSKKRKEVFSFMLYINTQEILIYIRQFMIAKKISVKELSQRLSKSQGATSALLKQSNMSLDTLNNICQAIDCDLHIDIISKKNNEK